MKKQTKTIGSYRLMESLGEGSRGIVYLAEHVQSGDIVAVKDGYGRNFLIPQKLAVIADEKSVKRLNHQKRLLEQKLKKELEAAKGFAGKIETTEITITRKAGENDKLFGSVTSQDIEEALRNEGIEVDRRAIVLGAPIKTLGYYTVTVKVASGVEAPLKIWVVGEE